MKKNYIDLSKVLKNLNCESGFYYDSFNKVYTGIRLIENMFELGFDVQDMSFCEHKKSQEFLRSLQNCSWFIVGMSSFDIFWHFLYRKNNITHYFPVYKQDNDNYFAADPMYGKENIAIEPSVIEKYAYEVKNIVSVKKIEHLNTGLKNLTELKNLNDRIAELKKIKNKILTMLKKYQNASETNKYKLIQYASAILNNKYLTKNYFILKNYDNNFIEDYKNQIINNWQGIKFGTQKLYAKPYNPELVHALSELVIKVTENEINLTRISN